MIAPFPYLLFYAPVWTDNRFTKVDSLLCMYQQCLCNKNNIENYIQQLQAYCLSRQTDQQGRYRLCVEDLKDWNSNHFEEILSEGCDYTQQDYNVCPGNVELTTNKAIEFFCDYLNFQEDCDWFFPEDILEAIGEYKKYLINLFVCCDYLLSILRGIMSLKYDMMLKTYEDNETGHCALADDYISSYYMIPIDKVSKNLYADYTDVKNKYESLDLSEYTFKPLLDIGFLFWDFLLKGIIPNRCSIEYSPQEGRIWLRDLIARDTNRFFDHSLSSISYPFYSNYLPGLSYLKLLCNCFGASDYDVILDNECLTKEDLEQLLWAWQSVRPGYHSMTWPCHWFHLTTIKIDDDHYLRIVTNLHFVNFRGYYCYFSCQYLWYYMDTAYIYIIKTLRHEWPPLDEFKYSDLFDLDTIHYTFSLNRDDCTSERYIYLDVPEEFGGVAFIAPYSSFCYDIPFVIKYAAYTV